MIASIRDVSQRKRLRDVGAGALRASEEERQRIARELHDDTAQHVATLMVHTRLMERAGPGEGWKDRLEHFREELGQLADGVRRIARGLRPPEPEDAGVVAAKLVLYRVVQEAVSNAARHAAASRLSVRVLREDHHVVASVEDDGRGFQPPRVQPTGPIPGEQPKEVPRV